jgi:glutamine amidotransferase
MACHVAYVGPEITLAELLWPGQRGALQASMQTELQRGAALPNGAGFGFGWYGAKPEALSYRRSEPIGSDHNLAAVAGHLRSDFWMAATRSFAMTHPGGYVNAQPFAADTLLFSHDGAIEHFRPQMRKHIQNVLAPEIEADIQGSSDSEYLFALIRQVYQGGTTGNLEDTLIEALNLLDSWLVTGQGATFNTLLCDGESLVAARYASDAACPGLYFATDEEAFPDGAVIVASEPLTQSATWHAVPENHLLVVLEDAPPELIPL